MSKGNAEKNQHDMSRMVHQASLSAMQVENHSEELLSKLDTVSKDLHAAAEYVFAYGEPAEYIKRLEAQNNFLDLLTTLIKERNGKK
jgi:hypothetical protein